MDLFLTNSLKRTEDRAALYRNLGDFRFERVPIPALEQVLARFPETGLPSAAAFVDYDGDGDEDLSIGFGYGPTRLLRNLKAETGAPGFADVTEEVGLGDHTVCLAAVFFDFDRDGRLDQLVTNALATHLPDYERPTPLNVFRLPPPAYPGDRRMLHFMHDGWHNAENGGPNLLYRGIEGGRFQKLDAAAFGMPETHWTVAAASVDLNRDGWTDLYLANDFGPDDIYLNRQGRGFERIHGRFFGEIGRDTYKGMNASVADFDGNGWLDVYVSDKPPRAPGGGQPAVDDLAGTRRRPESRPRRRPVRAAIPRPGDAARRAQREPLGLGRRGRRPRPGRMARHRPGQRHAGRPAGPALRQRRPQGLLVRESQAHAGGARDPLLRRQLGRSPRPHLYPDEPRRAYMNVGERAPGTFVDCAREIGIADPDDSRGVAMVDLDDDGDLDLVITNQHGPVSIYRNTLRRPGETASAPHFFGLRLVGNGVTTNRAAIGTRVEASWTAGGRAHRQVREVGLLGGFSGQDDPRLHFGLGDYSGPVRVEISGTGGQRRRSCWTADHYHEVRQP
jgi:hypothetical protein